MRAKYGDSQGTATFEAAAAYSVSRTTTCSNSGPNKAGAANIP